MYVINVFCMFLLFLYLESLFVKMYVFSMVWSSFWSRFGCIACAESSSNVM